MNQFSSRRRFLGLAGASLAGSMVPAWLSGCATAGSQKPVGRVVVVGGGFGGATAAKYIRMWSEKRIEVILVEPSAQFVSCPLSNLVLGGSRTIESLTLSRETLGDYGVRLIRDEVVAIDPDGKRAQLKGGEALSYDGVIVAPGIDFIYEDIPALAREDAQKVFLHAWKAGAQTVALRRQLEAMPDGGTFVLSIPKAPYRCPPGPYERASQVAYYFRQAKPKSKVLILDANPDIVSKKGLFVAAWKELYPGIIDYHPNQEVKDVDAKTLTVKTEFDTFRGDVVNVIPSQRAGSIAVRTKLVTANNRWCGVNWQTMESAAVAGVHVLGDATLAAQAMPKSASMANNHAKIAASAIVAQLTGSPVNPSPVISNTCYSWVSATEAVHITAVYRFDPVKKTLLPVEGAGGLSAKPSAQEKDYGDDWAVNIWADTLA
ncbi:MAG: FAD-dependent oxidoreductase [Betaproteobacteria bacterium]|nr:FAD-dependent oxidoreductase [Betaproteobacteria bacterium]